jgi:hypothetical protein
MVVRTDLPGEPEIPDHCCHCDGTGALDSKYGAPLHPKTKRAAQIVPAE